MIMLHYKHSKIYEVLGYFLAHVKIQEAIVAINIQKFMRT